MRVTDGSSKTLTDEQHEELMSLVADADSVELKVTIPASGVRSAGYSLGMDPLDAQIRQVYFFDTPGLTLNEHGVVAREADQGGPHDTVIKLRPVVPNDLPPELRASPNLGVEVDAMPGGFVCSASMKCVVGRKKIREAAGGDRPIRKLFSKEQRRFFAPHAPEGLGLDDSSWGRSSSSS